MATGKQEVKNTGEVSFEDIFEALGGEPRNWYLAHPGLGDLKAPIIDLT